MQLIMFLNKQSLNLGIPGLGTVEVFNRYADMQESYSIYVIL
jgi:hypothetical protein